MKILFLYFKMAFYFEEKLKLGMHNGRKDWDAFQNEYKEIETKK